MVLERRGLSTSGFYVHLTLQAQRPQWSRVLPSASVWTVAQQSTPAARYLRAGCSVHRHRG